MDKKLTTGTMFDKSSVRISRLFEQMWLSRYPRPRKVIFNNGSKFKKDFMPLLEDLSIRPEITTITIPQSNSPIERIHLVMRHMLSTKNKKRF